MCGSEYPKNSGPLMAVFFGSSPNAARAAVTYVKPHYAYVSEWSPASDRASAASAHSAAMHVYSTALENNPRVKPSRY